MQTRGAGKPPGPTPPELAFLQNAQAAPHQLLQRLPPQGADPLASPALLPTPSANLKGNKYKLYKVKGGPTVPWGRACSAPAQGLVERGRAARAPHIIPSCSSVLA